MVHQHKGRHRQETGVRQNVATCATVNYFQLSTSLEFTSASQYSAASGLCNTSSFMQVLYFFSTFTNEIQWG